MSRKRILLGIVAIAAAVIVLLFLFAPARVKVFAENVEIYTYVDEAGNANGRYVERILSPELEALLKQSISSIGIEKQEHIIEEAVRRDFGRLGIEMRNLDCEIKGLAAGANLELVLTWHSPNFARRDENGWVIILDWVNPRGAAEEAVAEIDYHWVTYRNIVEYLHAPGARIKTFEVSYIVLPEDAENVFCPKAGSSYHVDYGGGTWASGSISTAWVEGRFAVVDNSQTLFDTRNELTITPERFLESSPTLRVRYEKAFPENLTFVNSVNQVRLDLKYGRKLSEQYFILDGGSEYPLSPAQVLYYAADAIMTINRGDRFSLSRPLVPVSSPASERGEWRAAWKILSKHDYLAIAQKILSEIEDMHRAPGTVETPIGSLRFRDVLYTLLRILAAYEEKGDLPTEVLFAPVPTGYLASDHQEFPARLAYFLLGDAFAVVDGEGAKSVLRNVLRPGYDDRELASGIFDWTHGNIAYALELSPPTSEEVIRSKHGQCRDFANVYLALTRTAGIPARRVFGWIVSEATLPSGLWELVVGRTPEGKPIAGHVWTQVFIDGKWVSVDPTMGYFETLRYEVYKQTEQTWSGALACYETEHGVL